jgi:hypothetical protein
LSELAATALLTFLAAAAGSMVGIELARRAYTARERRLRLRHVRVLRRLSDNVSRRVSRREGGTR